MSRAVILGGVLAAVALPSAAYGGDGPTSADRTNAAQECRYERGSAAATREAFAAKYRTFGRCVSTRARDEAAERRAARAGAAKTCKAERGTTAESRRAFEQRYGTNGNKRNAHGKCVSQAAKAHENKADAADRRAADARINAAKQCASERGTTVASRKAFADKYATNAGKANAFGKCVSEKARESS
jgi:hypothetical protein